jgi:phosphoserine phosphatase
LRKTLVITGSSYFYVSKFKEKLDLESCKALFREMTLEWYDTTKIIFRHGDPGRKMYFVL